jgi:hypothetical protein
MSLLKLKRITSYAGAAAIAVSCTQTGNVRLAQQLEVFDPTQTQDVNTKLDLLWVIDTSGSMDPFQQKTREGLVSFAQKYMKPTWDIRIAVITTDTYLAHTSFQNFLNNRVNANTGNYAMNYLNGLVSYTIVQPRSQPFVNPSWAPDLTYWDAGTSRLRFRPSGVRLLESKPQLGPNWAKLLPGNHDGPQLGLCFDRDEITPSFFNGVNKCFIRDNPGHPQYGTGVENCVYPKEGQSSVTQCVNTVMNDTVHSGKPILSTIPPRGVPADAAWTEQLYRDFIVNVSVSTLGSGSERAFNSVEQLLEINEVDPALRFFRPDALRVIIFLGDENDQSMFYSPTPVTSLTQNYVSSTSICRKTVGGVTYGPGSCPDPAWELPVATFKDELDAFFRALDGKTASEDPNYFVVGITRLTGTGSRGDRYADLANAVGNGSLIMNIDSSDYAPLLDSIGQVIVSKKAVFQLLRAPTQDESLLVYIMRSDGTTEAIPPSKYTIEDRTLTINDQALVLGLSAEDRIAITYQPKTIF